MMKSTDARNSKLFKSPRMAKLTIWFFTINFNSMVAHAFLLLGCISKTKCSQ